MKASPFQGILVFVCIIGGIIGVYVFATYTSNQTGSSDIGKVKIWGTLSDDEFNAALQAANTTTPDLKAVTYSQKPAASFDEDLINAIATGNPPDLVLISQEDILPLQKVITLMSSSDLPERTFETTFADGADIFWTSNNSGAYGMPLLIDPLVMFVNRPLLSSNGVASPPSTWEAFTGLAPRIVQKSAGNTLTRGLTALGTYSNVHDARGILSALFFQANVPITKVASNGFRTVNLGTQVGGQGPSGQGVLRFYTQFADPTKISYTWNAAMPDSQSEFMSGDLALYLGFASEANYFKRANPNLDFDVVALPQPATASKKITFGKVYALAIPRGAVNPVGGFRAAKLLTSATINRTFATATGLAPSVRSVLASPPSSSVGGTAYASALYAKGWLSPSGADVDKVFSVMINNVTSGRLDIDSALSSAEIGLSALLQQQ